MSLPTLFSSKELLDKKYLIFLLGFSFTIVSVFFSLKLFPEDPGIVGVVFVSMMSLRMLTKMFENINRYPSYFEFTVDIFKVYLLLFLGVFVAFMTFSYFLPYVASSNLFNEQLNLFGFENFSSDLVNRSNTLGNALQFSDNFYSIFSNNFVVLFFCFIVSFFFGSGALFIILWNASVWGIILGNIFRLTSFDKSLIILISILPHALLEISSYIFAAIAGIILSSIIEDNSSNKKQKFYFFICLIFTSFVFLIIAAFLESL